MAHTRQSTPVDPDAEHHHRRRSHRVALASLAVAAVGLLAVPVAVFDWLDWRPGGTAASTPGTDAVPGGHGGPVGTTKTTTPPPAFTYLSTLTPDNAGALDALPGNLTAGEHPRALTIRCPAKGSVTEIGYDLLSDYASFSARVFTDTRTRVLADVAAFVITQNRDGTTVKRQLDRTTVSPTAGGKLGGDVRGIMRLVVQVDCDTSQGHVVVDDGRLTLATTS